MRSNMSLMMRAVWMNPGDRAAQLACADVLVEELDWSYENALSHAEYHARRSYEFRVNAGLPENGEYE